MSTDAAREGAAPSNRATLEPEVTDPAVSGWLPTLLLAVASLACLALALVAPLATTVIGLIVFGIGHNVLEIRYVAGKFPAMLTGRFLTLLAVLITGILCCRALSSLAPTVTSYAEIALGYLVLMVGAAWGLTGTRLALALAVLMVAAPLSLFWPGWHFVVLTHLHNVVPLFFLWQWSQRLHGSSRTGFRGTQLGWLLVIPALVLLGVADPFLSPQPGIVESFVGNGSKVIAASAPPHADVVMGMRFLAVFAFMQSMHYVVWLGFLPRFAPEAAQAFDRRVPWLRGWRTWLLAGLAGVAMVALFTLDYFHGKAVYAALASYHAYIEFPVLLAMLLGGAGLSTSANAAHRPA